MTDNEKIEKKCATDISFSLFPLPKPHIIVWLPNSKPGSDIL